MTLPRWTVPLILCCLSLSLSSYTLTDPSKVSDSKRASEVTTMAGEQLVIFVCTSNVCRSPMAEAFAKAYVETLEPKPSLRVISRGLTDGYSSWGSPANSRAVEVMKETYSLDLGAHRSASLKPEEMDTASAIFVVTSEHIGWVRSAVPKSVFDRNKDKVRTIGLDVPDPYFFSKQAYIDVGQMLDEQVSIALKDFLDGKPGSVSKDPRSDDRNNRCYSSWPRK